MLNNDVNTLTKKLKNIYLEQTNTIEHLKKINEAETDTLKELTEAQAKTPKKGDCPFVVGDILRTNNCLRQEYRIMGMVTKVCNTRVAIRNSATGDDYQRAWWNLELVESVTSIHPKKRRAQK